MLDYIVSRVFDLIFFPSSNFRFYFFSFLKIQNLIAVTLLLTDRARYEDSEQLWAVELPVVLDHVDLQSDIMRATLISKPFLFSW